MPRIDHDPPVLDLDPGRTDRYDLTDWRREHHGGAQITTSELIACAHTHRRRETR